LGLCEDAAEAIKATASSGSPAAEHTAEDDLVGVQTVTRLLFDVVLRREGRPGLKEWRSALKTIYSHSAAASRWLLEQVTSPGDPHWLQRHLLSAPSPEAPQTFCFAIAVAVRYTLQEPPPGMPETDPATSPPALPLLVERLVDVLLGEMGLVRSASQVEAYAMLWNSILGTEFEPLRQHLVRCDLLARLVHLFLADASPATPEQLPAVPAPDGIPEYKLLFNCIASLVPSQPLGEASGEEVPELSRMLLRSQALKHKLYWSLYYHIWTHNPRFYSPRP